MTSSTDRAFSSLLARLLEVRQSGRDSVSEYLCAAKFGAVQGHLAALEDLGVITWDQLVLLTDLLLNASKHAGEPFPSVRNAGPLIPYYIASERSRSVEAVPHVPAKVPAPAPHTGLRLLCLLVTSRTGETCALPVHTMRPMPPAVLRPGRWSLARDPAFVLRETHAVRPPAEVLARYSRQRQTNAVCAPRAIV